MAHKFLNSLTASQVKKMDAEINKGTPLSQVAKILQNKWKVLEHMTPASLAKTLARYRDDVLENQLIERIKEAGGLDYTKETIAGVDIADEMLFVAKAMKGRLLKLYEKEESLPVLLNDVTKHLEAYANHLTKMANLFMDMGFIKKATREFEGLLNVDETSGVVSFKVTERTPQMLEDLKAKYGPATIEGSARNVTPEPTFEEADAASHDTL